LTAAAPLAGLVALLLCASFASARSILPGMPLPPLAPGDALTILPGVHTGPWRIDVPGVTLSAQPGAILDGGGIGSALTVTAADVAILGLTIRHVGSTADLTAPDAAIALLGADRAFVHGVVAYDVTSAVHVEAAAGVVVRYLRASGDGRGPGVTAYLTPDLQLLDAQLHGFADGIYVERADRARIASNEIVGSERYGVHAMFSVAPTIADNHVAAGGVGSAVMYGRDAILSGNTLVGHRGAMAFGLLLTEERDATLTGNRLVGNTIGALLVAAPGATLQATSFEGNGVAVLLDRPPSAAAGASDVAIRASRFVGNAADVAVADPQAALVLSGNAFDRAVPLDLDRDGIGDLPHAAASGFAARAAAQQDLLLFAFGPGVALWERLEASVPGIRAVDFADAAAVPLRSAAPPSRPAALLAGAFAALAIVGRWW
jgi:nitrous oxidase accessory protein